MNDNNKNFFNLDFSFENIKGEKISFKQFEGKAILIVNTASECGFTPQYEGLQKIYEQYQGKLMIIAFPCNQFGSQEPKDHEEIQKFCDLNFHITFPLSKKIEVNGKNTHPLFDYLKKALPGLMGSKTIKWNFTKFLIAPNGVPYKRYAPTIKPEELIEDIEKILLG